MKTEEQKNDHKITHRSRMKNTVGWPFSLVSFRWFVGWLVGCKTVVVSFRWYKTSAKNKVDRNFIEELLLVPHDFCRRLYLEKPE